MDRRRFVRSALLAGGAGALGAIGTRGPLAAGTATGDDGPDARDFGAKGDGTADDGDALRRAFREGDGVLRLPRGTYRITRPVEIDLSDRGPAAVLGAGTARVVVDGPGPAFHFRGTHDGTANPASVDDAVWERERLPLIRGVEIVGAHEDAVGVLLERTFQATFGDVLIRRCRTGIRVAGRNRNLLVTGCHIYRNREVGIDLDRVNLHQTVIASNHVSYNPVAGIRVRGGEIRNLQIVGNDIEYNYSTEREGSADVLLDPAADEEGTCRECTIAGNTIQARPSPGGANVRIAGNAGLGTAGMAAITGNLIGSQTATIRLDRCRTVSVTGNTLYGAMGPTFLLRRCAHTVIDGNTIDRIPVPGGKRHVDGIRIEGCDAVQITGTILENCLRGSEEEGGAIEIVRSRDVAVSDCQVLDPRWRGIVLEDAVRCRISDTSIVDRHETPRLVATVRVRGGRDNLLRGNFLTARPDDDLLDVDLADPPVRLVDNSFLRGRAGEE